MKTETKKQLADWGLARRIERHNFLIYRLIRNRVKSFQYHGRVIDLGCGKAPYKDIILQTADEYIGVDWQNSYFDKSNVDVFAELTEPLPFDSDYADTIVCFNVIDDLPEPNLFFSECQRVLKPGGSLYLITPFLWRIHDEPNDYCRYTNYGLDYLLRKNGFTEIVIEPLSGFWQMWWLSFNYHTLCFARGPLKYLFYPLWWLTQMVAPLMDKINPGSGHLYTTHYSVQAKKT